MVLQPEIVLTVNNTLEHDSVNTRDARNVLKGEQDSVFDTVGVDDVHIQNVTREQGTTVFVQHTEVGSAVLLLIVTNLRWVAHTCVHLMVVEKDVLPKLATNALNLAPNIA